MFGWQAGCHSVAITTRLQRVSACRAEGHLRSCSGPTPNLYNDSSLDPHGFGVPSPRTNDGDVKSKWPGLGGRPAAGKLPSGSDGPVARDRCRLARSEIKLFSDGAGFLDLDGG